MKKGIIIADASLNIDPPPKVPVVMLPILDTASKKLGKAVVANMVALGVLGGISGVASPEALREAVRNRVPKGTEELNIAALEQGLLLAKQAKAQLGLI